MHYCPAVSRFAIIQWSLTRCLASWCLVCCPGAGCVSSALRCLHSLPITREFDLTWLKSHLHVYHRPHLLRLTLNLHTSAMGLRGLWFAWTLTNSNPQSHNLGKQEVSSILLVLVQCTISAWVAPAFFHLFFFISKCASCLYKLGWPKGLHRQ